MISDQQQHGGVATPACHLGFLTDGGHVSEIIRTSDWSQSPLGPIGSWPVALRMTLSTLLRTPSPTALFWGPDFRCFLNDACQPYLTARPGTPAAEIFTDSWDSLRPVLQDVRASGNSSATSLGTAGAFHLSPVLDENGYAEGVLATPDLATANPHDQRLTENDARFRALVTTTADVIYQMSPDWSVMRRLDGKGVLSDTEGPAGDWREKYLHPSDRKKVDEAIAASISTRSPFALEHTVYQADGTLGWTFSRAVPILDEHGEIIEWFGAFTDITKRKQTELDIRKVSESLEKSKRLYETITDNTPDLIYVFDLNYRFSYANKALLAMWGKTWDEAIGQGLRALGYEEWHATMHEREIDLIAEKKEPVRGTVTFPHAEFGTRYYDYILAPVLGEDGEVEAVAGTTRDVTDIKLAEAATLESEARFRVLADSMPQMIWSTLPDGYHDYYNAQWYKYTGMPPGSTDGEGWNNMFHPDDQQRAWGRWQHSLLTGEPYEIEYRLRRYDGEYRWVLGRALPLRNEAGKVTRWFGTCTEIHDQKQLAERLEHLVDERTVELQRSNEDLQQFAHVASHDLKEPVRKIITFSNMLDTSDGSQLSDRGRMSLTKIHNSADRMMNMITGILAYSKVAASDQAWQTVDLHEVIQGVEADLELAIAQKHAVITKGDLPAVTGAPVLIYQLFYNLINNSLKFSRPDVAPHITVSGRDMPRRGRVEVSVEDNGIGFEQQYEEVIFRTFTRLHSKDQYEGTGLGLSLCKRIVERHGGTIRAQGNPGAGARITLSLPAEQPAV